MLNDNNVLHTLCSYSVKFFILQINQQLSRMHATVISAFGIVYLLFLFLGHLSAQITVSPSTFNPLMVDSKPEPATKTLGTLIIIIQKGG